MQILCLETVRYGKASIRKVDDQAFMPVQEAHELSKVGRSDVVIDCAEVSVVGYVERVRSEPDVMPFAILALQKGNPELTINLHIK